MGSILGAIVTGYVLGVLEGLTKVFYPEASSIVIFVVMAVVLLVPVAAVVWVLSEEVVSFSGEGVVLANRIGSERKILARLRLHGARPARQWCAGAN